MNLELLEEELFMRETRDRKIDVESYHPCQFNDYFDCVGCGECLLEDM